MACMWYTYIIETYMKYTCDFMYDETRREEPWRMSAHMCPDSSHLLILVHWNFSLYTALWIAIYVVSVHFLHLRFYTIGSLFIPLNALHIKSRSGSRWSPGCQDSPTGRPDTCSYTQKLGPDHLCISLKWDLFTVNNNHTPTAINMRTCESQNWTTKMQRLNN